jgi:hypothetical protein
MLKNAKAQRSHVHVVLGKQQSRDAQGNGGVHQQRRGCFVVIASECVDDKTRRSRNWINRLKNGQ